MRTCLHDCQHVVEYSTVMTLRGSRYAARPAVHSTHALACGVQAEKHAVHRSRGVRVMEAGAGVRRQAAGQVQGGVPAALLLRPLAKCGSWLALNCRGGVKTKRQCEKTHLD